MPAGVVMTSTDPTSLPVVGALPVFLIPSGDAALIARSLLTPLQ
ncbi:hypothetical protein KR100_13865 [Synechococcus sp. KORDI-100]|nr:hypothetical protein KR100_13865 [Synechococcus sp. KORDI-100]